MSGNPDFPNCPNCTSDIWCEKHTQRIGKMIDPTTRLGRRTAAGRTSGCFTVLARPAAVVFAVAALGVLIRGWRR